MKLVELPNSPFWGGNIHVGYNPDGTKRYRRMSSKVRRDPSMVNQHGGREDKILALKVLTEMQSIANRSMDMAKETNTITLRERGEMLDQLLRACGLSLASPAPSWDKFATQVLDRNCRDLAPASARSYRAKRNNFDKWLSKHATLSKETSVADFRLADIQEFYDWWVEQGASSTTVNAGIKVLSMVFARALVEGLIPKNPCSGVKKRDGVMIPRQPFTLADLTKLSRALVEHSDGIEFAGEWALAIRFSIFTGAREGDCVSLSWDCFSDDFRSVRFVPQKKANLHALGKVDASVSLMLPEFVAAEFRAAHAASNCEWVTPNLRTIPAGQWGLGARFRQIMDLAGVTYTIRPAKGPMGNDQASHTFHSFRHLVQTEMRAAGVSAESRNFVTGHDDAKVAMRYVHEKSEVVFRECEPVFKLFEQALGE